MSYISKNILKNMNVTHKPISKENNQHSQSPNVRPIYNPQKPIKNNLFPKKYNNHNINPINGNIQVNIIRAKKDKDKGRIQITYLHPSSSGQRMALDVMFPLLGYELIQGSSFQGLAQPLPLGYYATTGKHYLLAGERYLERKKESRYIFQI